MRKFNAILVLIIMILFLDHLFFGSAHFLGTGLNVTKPFSHTFFLLVLIHAAISLIITVRAEIAGIRTKARYNRENREFWSRRISGVAILVLAGAHAYLMVHGEDGLPRISKMARIYELFLPLLLLSISIHLSSNVKPLLIALGIRNPEKKEKIIKALIVLITIVALFSFVFFIYSKVRHGG